MRTRPRGWTRRTPPWTTPAGTLTDLDALRTAVREHHVLDVRCGHASLARADLPEVSFRPT
ncbi:hypothetical protein [Nocardioides okcheonensis]|uniref:hypothetical protein n=1 Tax=Nocardioides okcheonensis TaxID=2894081 RepID=UPI001E41A180|nr:hypothetical protein [Nocardioides okcheonensis]UFN43890.1 hypothetical protein LN652_17855 [Nocardioides okcheonensis]